MPNVSTLPFNGNVSYIGDVRRFDDGGCLVNVGVIQNRRRQDGEGNWVDGDATRINVLVTGRLAENVVKSLKVGQRVVVAGNLRVRTWKDSDGNERTTTEIVARDIGPSLQFGTTTFEQRVTGSSPSQEEVPPLPEQEETEEEALDF